MKQAKEMFDKIGILIKELQLFFRILFEDKTVIVFLGVYLCLSKSYRGMIDFLTSINTGIVAIILLLLLTIVFLVAFSSKKNLLRLKIERVFSKFSLVLIYLFFSAFDPDNNLPLIFIELLFFCIFYFNTYIFYELYGDLKKIKIDKILPIYESFDLFIITNCTIYSVLNFISIDLLSEQYLSFAVWMMLLIPILVIALSIFRGVKTAQTIKLKFKCYIEDLSDMDDIKDKGFYSDTIIDGSRPNYHIFKVELDELYDRLFNISDSNYDNCVVKILNFHARNIQKCGSYFYLMTNKNDNDLLKLNMIIENGEKRYYVIVALKTDNVGDFNFVSYQETLVAKRRFLPLPKFIYRIIDVNRKFDYQYLAFQSIVIDDDEADKMKDCSKIMNSYAIDSRKFYVHSGDYGVGKTLIDTLIINTNGNLPLVISGYSDGIENDFIRYVFNKLQLQIKGKTAASFYEYVAILASATSVLIYLINISGFTIKSLVMWMFNIFIGETVNMLFFVPVVTIVIIVLILSVAVRIIYNTMFSYVSSKFRITSIQEDYYCEKIYKLIKKKRNIRIVIEDIDRLDEEHLRNLFTKINILNSNLINIDYPIGIVSYDENRIKGKLGINEYEEVFNKIFISEISPELNLNKNKIKYYDLNVEYLKDYVAREKGIENIEQIINDCAIKDGDNFRSLREKLYKVHLRIDKHIF